MITQAYITLKNLLFLYVNLEGDSVLFKGEGMGSFDCFCGVWLIIKKCKIKAECYNLTKTGGST